MNEKLRVGVIGCGAMGQYILDFLSEGKLPACVPVAVYLKSSNSRGRDYLEARKIPWVTQLNELMAFQPDVVLEAATHDAVKEMGASILESGVDFVPMSLGAFVDYQLLEKMAEASRKGKSRLHIPSGGIGALDALQAAVLGGVQKVTMTTRKYSTTWKGIPAVESMGLDLEKLKEPVLLFEGPAKECVKLYPQSINIAAALSIAGVGFEKTIIKIYADPFVKYNTHEIEWEGFAGKVTVTFENTPVPSNPKTTYQACLSVLSVLNGMCGTKLIGA